MFNLLCNKTNFFLSYSGRDARGAGVDTDIDHGVDQKIGTDHQKSIPTDLAAEVKAGDLAHIATILNARKIDTGIRIGKGTGTETEIGIMMAIGTEIKIGIEIVTEGEIGAEIPVTGNVKVSIFLIGYGFGFIVH